MDVRYKVYDHHKVGKIFIARYEYSYGRSLYPKRARGRIFSSYLFRFPNSETTKAKSLHSIPYLQPFVLASEPPMIRLIFVIIVYMTFSAALHRF